MPKGRLHNGSQSFLSFLSFEKARFLIEEVERIGAEPFRAPDPLPPIEANEIHLICWMALNPMVDPPQQYLFTP